MCWKWVCNLSPSSTTTQDFSRGQWREARGLELRYFLVRISGAVQGPVGSTENSNSQTLICWWLYFGFKQGTDPRGFYLCCRISFLWVSGVLWEQRTCRVFQADCCLSQSGKRDAFISPAACHSMELCGIKTWPVVAPLIWQVICW